MTNNNTKGSDPLQSRTLNVELPASVYWHIRECATLSRMSLKEFMSEFGIRAEPIQTTDDIKKYSPDSPG